MKYFYLWSLDYEVSSGCKHIVATGSKFDGVCDHANILLLYGFALFKWSQTIDICFILMPVKIYINFCRQNELAVSKWGSNAVRGR